MAGHDPCLHTFGLSALAGRAARRYRLVLVAALTLAASRPLVSAIEDGEVNPPMPAAYRLGQARRLQTVVNPNTPADYIALSNVDNVPDTWVVHEFELFFGHCYQNKRIVLDAQMVVSSGTRPENAFDVATQAVDEDLSTVWYSQCKRPIGGCQEHQAWIGQDLTITQEFRDANINNVTEELLEAARVRCVRFYQSVDPLRRTSRIAIREGRWNGAGTTWTTFEVLDDCAGGIWARKPGIENALWRISNLASTVAGWAVSELKFYEDILCTWPITGAGSFSSPTKAPLETNSVFYAFDDDTTTKWVAGCELGGCFQREAHLGIDMSTIVKTVRCIRMYQYLHDFESRTPEDPSYTSGIELDRWDGLKWVPVERFWDQHFAFPVDMGPTFNTPYLGIGPGVWEDTRTQNNSAWRLVNDDYIYFPWQVHELEFYTSADCTGDVVTGEPLSMQGPAGVTEVGYAFDGSSEQDPVRLWTSGCSGINGSCAPKEAWLGIYVRGSSPDVKCFRLFQTRTMINQARSIVLSAWQGGEWVHMSLHRDVGGGGWNRRPAPPRTMWRVTNLAPVVEQWKIAEVRAYSDPICLFELPRDLAIASGYMHFIDTFDRAWDDRFDTSWGADCNPCNSTQNQWLGMQMPHASGNTSTGLDFLRCIKVWQSHRFDEQSRGIRIQVWDGTNWAISPSVIDQPYIGGGQWSRHPASHMTKWRLRPLAAEDMYWRMTELEFYSSVDCLPETRLPMPITGRGGASVTLSGFDQELAGYPLIQAMTDWGGDGVWSEGLRGMDATDQTSTRLVHKPSEGLPAWFGVDFLSETTWVRCVRVQQGNLKPEQSPSLILEFWQGRNWTGLDMELGPTEFRLEGLGGSGYHRRPAQENSLWRLENGEHVAEGWAVYEVQFHNVETCVAEEIGASSQLSGSSFASGHAPSDVYDNRPSSAFDQSLSTAWVAQCAFIPEDLRPDDLQLPAPGCAPGEAWIGLDIGRSEPVRCVRILQVGYRKMQSSIIDLSRWDGRAWQHAWRLHGIGGNSWNQRPAMSNTMWRIFEHTPKVERCPGQMRRTFNRPWGVAELGFYSDDSCSSEITGGLAISSGSVETFIRSNLDAESYNIENAFDGDENTAWAANCLLGWRESRSERVTCQDEWLGLDFVGVAVEVRCVRFQQARLESPTCCDMAEEVELQRWNGTRWVEAKWRHEPGPGSPEAFRWLGATFTGVGECPADSYTGSYRNVKIWTQRSRRDSDSCLVPLSTGISLLAEPACVEHSRCIFAHGPGGVCCPMQGLESRCCCNFLTGERYSEPIFVDEEDTNKVRASLAVEFAVVLVSDYLPFIGAGLAVWLYLMAIILPVDALERVARWLAERPTCGRKVLAVLAWPTLTWRNFLAESDSLTALACVWCCLPNRRRPRPVETPRFVLFLFAGILIVGVMPFLGMGLLLGKIFLNISLMLCIVVRWTKSPYDPQKPMDMRMRAAATLEPLQQADDSAQASHVAFDFVTFVILGFVYYLKFIFDLLLIRAQMISYSAIGPIEAERVVDIFPGMMRPLREPAMLIYWVMYHAGQMVSYTIGFLIGLPRCEGATALIACVALVLVLVTVTQWLNYDFFGLFAAGRQAVKTTRPACQRVMAQAAIMASLSVVFGIIQCSMVLFSRALNMANPFKEQVWMCEWNDTFALYMGRGLLLLTALGGLIFVALCVNGHFMGQDYIIKPVGRMLGLNLDALDPDGTGPRGGIVRCNTGFSALPTILGIWCDWWNISAFLVKERAHVYATQLNDPQPCRKCGQVHVSYSSMMCATGRQIGLACQILPYGILIGKASEYFNDPPIAYFGSELPCYSWRLGPVEPRPILGKRKYGLWWVLLCADVCTFLIEYGLPVVRRLCAICLFLAMLAGTFLVTETNLVKMGGNVVLAGFYLSFIKAGGEAFFETTLSFTVGVLYKAIYEAEGSLEDIAPIPRTVAGQTLVGTVVGSVLCVVVPVAGWATEFEGAAFACVFGYFVSLVTLGVSFALEEKVVPGRVRRASSFRLSAKLLYALAMGCFVGLLASSATVLRGVIGLAMAVTAVTAVSLQVLLLGARVVADPFDPQAVDNGMWDSPAIMVLASLHFLPGLVGIPCGTVASVFVGDWMFGGYTQVVARASLAMPIAMFCGAIVALTVNRLLRSYAQLIGSFAGLGAFVLLGLWKPTYATAISVFFGATVGSVFELCLIVERIEAEEAKIKEEVVGRAKEAELRARKGLAPLSDEFTTPEEAEQLKNWEEKANAFNRDARFTAAKARCLADAPIANGLACEIYGDTLVIAENKQLAMQDGIPGDIAVKGNVTQGFTTLRMLADPMAATYAESVATEDLMRQDQPFGQSGVVTLEEPTSPSNFSLREYEDLQQQPTFQLPDSEPVGLAPHALPAPPPEEEAILDSLPAALYPQNALPPAPTVPSERPPSAPHHLRNGFQPAPMPTDIVNDSGPHQSSQQSQAGSTARRRPGAGRALALVDNLKLERDDDDEDNTEEPSPQPGVLALAKPEEPQKQAPATFVPQEEDDDKLFGRWDRSGNAPGRRGRSEPRRVQRAVPKPSLWAHRVAPPPAAVPSFRDDRRAGGKRPPVT